MSKRERLDRPEAIQLRVQRLVQGLAHRIRSHRLVGGNTAATATTEAGGQESRVHRRAEAQFVGRIRQPALHALLRRMLAGGNGRIVGERTRDRNTRRGSRTNV